MSYGNFDRRGRLLSPAVAAAAALGLALVAPTAALAVDGEADSLPKPHTPEQVDKESASDLWEPTTYYPEAYATNNSVSKSTGKCEPKPVYVVTGIEQPIKAVDYKPVVYTFTPPNYKPEETELSLDPNYNYDIAVDENYLYGINGFFERTTTGEITNIANNGQIQVLNLKDPKDKFIANVKYGTGNPDDDTWREFSAAEIKEIGAFNALSNIMDGYLYIGASYTTQIFRISVASLLDKEKEPRATAVGNFQTTGVFPNINVGGSGGDFIGMPALDGGVYVLANSGQLVQTTLGTKDSGTRIGELYDPVDDTDLNDTEGVYLNNQYGVTASGGELFFAGDGTKVYRLSSLPEPGKKLIKVDKVADLELEKQDKDITFFGVGSENESLKGCFDYRRTTVLKYQDYTNFSDWKSADSIRVLDVQTVVTDKQSIPPNLETAKFKGFTDPDVLKKFGTCTVNGVAGEWKELKPVDYRHFLPKDAFPGTDKFPFADLEIDGPEREATRNLIFERDEQGNFVTKEITLPDAFGEEHTYTEYKLNETAIEFFTSKAKEANIEFSDSIEWTSDAEFAFYTLYQLLDRDRMAWDQLQAQLPNLSMYDGEFSKDNSVLTLNQDGRVHIVPMVCAASDKPKPEEPKPEEPKPEVTPTPTPSSTPEVTPTPTPSSTPEVTPTPSLSASAAPVPSASPSPSVSAVVPQQVARKVLAKTGSDGWVVLAFAAALTAMGSGILIARRRA